MRQKLFSGALMLILSIGIFAQVPQGFNYQAIARDASGNEIVGTALDVQISILASLVPVVLLWEEEHSVTTNEYGLFKLVVGDLEATRIGGLVTNFEDIDWAGSQRYIKTEVYYEETWHVMGTSLLMSVPFSMVADRAHTLVSNELNLGGNTLSIVGGDVSNPDALLEVRRSDGEVILGVYNDGVEINVPYNMPVKGPKGGFAIGGFDVSKKGPTEEYLVVTRDSSRVYVNQNATKGQKGGFAIGGFDGTKAAPVNFLNLTHQNYFIGQDAGDSITDGVSNAFFGFEAGASMKTGSNNVFLGHQTGYSTTDGQENVFIGNKAGYAASGYDNIFIGNQAGEQSSGTTHNTLIGNEAGWNITGDDNILIGDRAAHNLYEESHEVMNTVVLGVDASRNFGGYNNTFLGYGSGYKGGSSGSGDNNTFVGAMAGFGSTNKLGSNNVCLGYEAGYSKSGDNKLYIANNSTTTLIYGEFDNEYLLVDGDMDVTGDLTANSYANSDERYKTNIESIGSTLSIISDIPAVYYKWKTEEFVKQKFSADRQIGFIAQDVEKYFPELVRTNREGYKSLDYSKMSVVLLQAIKEQQAVIIAQDEEVSDLRLEVQSLEQRLSQLESVISSMVQNQ